MYEHTRYILTKMYLYSVQVGDDVFGQSTVKNFKDHGVCVG